MVNCTTVLEFLPGTHTRRFPACADRTTVNEQLPASKNIRRHGVHRVENSQRLPENETAAPAGTASFHAARVAVAPISMSP